MSENTIELPLIKPKKVYKKKPKETTPIENVEPQLPILSLEVPKCVEPQSVDLDESIKPKRVYKRKPKCVESPPLLDESVSRIRLTTELIDTPPSSPKAVAEPVVKEKKPRTERQIAAFNKMREARIAKQAELNRLNDLEKEERRIDSEKVKLDKITERVVNKATEIKKKRASRKKEIEPVEDFREPQQIHISQETNNKKIMFV